MIHDQRTPSSMIGNNISTYPEHFDDDVDLFELMHRLLAGWKLIVCLALALTVLAGVVTAAFIPPQYDATAVISVLNRDGQNVSYSDIQIGTALVQAYIKIFDTWEVHDEVSKRLNLSYPYSRMQDMLTVTTDSNTLMFNIMVSSSNPNEAASMANEYAKVGAQYIAAIMPTGTPSVVSTARTPTDASGPNMLINIAIGFVAGIMLAVIILTAQMFIDDKYKTSNDIYKYTGLVTLATVRVDTGVANASKGGRKA